MDYNNYLKSNHWIEFRKKVYRNKKNRSCKICGSSDRLNIHHRKYQRENRAVLYGEHRGDIIVLCQSCHYLWHKLFDKKNLRTEHVYRIKNLLGLGLQKQKAFANCVGKKYRKMIASQKETL